MEESVRVLVVDDDPIALDAAVIALRDFGLLCETANDGSRAQEKLMRTKFHAVITDLRMPNRNGHSLAIDLVGRQGERPLVFVLTAVTEPRLVRDLIIRGVDDVTSKPVDLKSYVAKIAAMCERRSLHVNLRDLSRPRTEDGVAVTVDEFNSELNSFANLMLSTTHMHVIEAINQSWPNVSGVVPLVAQDSALLLDVLKAANSLCSSPKGSFAEDLEDAIERGGEQEIAILSLVAIVKSTLSRKESSWPDKILLWQRSIAAGLALKQLNSIVDPMIDDGSLFFTSLTLPLSNCLRGMLFPQIYSKLKSASETGTESLDALEHSVPLPSPPKALAEVLGHWKFPTSCIQWLERVGSRKPEEIGRSPEDENLLALLRLSVFAGECAVSAREPWEAIDIPKVSGSLSQVDIKKLIDDVRESLEKAQVLLTRWLGQLRALPPYAGKSVAYTQVVPQEFDGLAVYLRSIGLQLTSVSESPQNTLVVLNCSGAPHAAIANAIDELGSREYLLVCDNVLHDASEYGRQAISLPGTFRVLDSALRSFLCR